MPTENQLKVSLDGILNEDFEYETLIQQIQKHSFDELVLDLSQVYRVNSMGIREWFNFIKALKGIARITLENCSTTFTQALIQIEEMAEGCHVHSIYLAVWCPSCEEDFDVLIHLEDLRANAAQEYPCPTDNRFCPADLWGIEGILKRQA